MKLKTIKQTINSGLCIGCGLCSFDNRVKMCLMKGMWQPNAITHSEIINESCPAKGYNLKFLGNSLFGDINYVPEIGYYRSIQLVHSTNQTLLKNASSGGMMTQIASALLRKSEVNGVITTRFVYDNNHVRTETFIATNEEELIKGQGSKYCPTSTLSIIKELDPQKKYLLIGTPCQIAGYRMFANLQPNVKEMIPYTMANFCGGYRDFKELDFFVSKIAHTKNVVYFRHRGGGQPGSMRIEGEKGELFQYPYPEYATLSPYVKNERCTLCMDATGELADFSCGDAWLEHKDTAYPWSILISRSRSAVELIKELCAEGFVVEGEQLSPQKVIDSQKSNITSKKYRQYKRIKVRDALFMLSPKWYDNFPAKNGSYLNEFKIILSKQKAKWQNKH